MHSECTKKRGLFDISRRILRFCQKRKKEDLADEEPNTTSNALGNGAANKGENTMLYDGSDDILIKRYLETSASIFSSIFQKHLKQLVNGVTVVEMLTFYKIGKTGAQ